VTAGCTIFYLLANVVGADAGFGSISPVAFFVALVLLQLFLWVPFEDWLPSEDGDAGGVKVAKPSEQRDGQIPDDGVFGRLFGARTPQGSSGSAALPARGERARKSNGGEGMLKRLTRRLSNGSRSSAQDQPGGR
jgi:hypothetical protein